MAILFIRHWACRMKGVIRNAGLVEDPKGRQEERVYRRIAGSAALGRALDTNQRRKTAETPCTCRNQARRILSPIATPARHASRGPSPANLGNTLAVQQWACPGWNEVRPPSSARCIRMKAAQIVVCLRRPWTHRICGLPACGTKPGRCLVASYWPPRRGPCDQIDDRSRRAWLARREL